MIKKIIAIVLCIVSALSLAGCGKVAEYTPKDIVNEIRRNIEFDELTRITGDQLSNYFSFSDKDVENFAVFMSVSDETTDMIAAFEYNSTENRAKIIDGISQYLTNTSGSFKIAMELEHNKIQNRVLMELSNIVVLVVCDDYSVAGEVLTKMGAKPLT